MRRKARRVVVYHYRRRRALKHRRTTTNNETQQMTTRIAPHSLHPVHARRPLQALIATGLLLFANAVFAYQPPSSAPDEADLDNHNTYRNSDGATVHAPAHSRSGTVPEGASARCRDATYSFSRHHSGTCSRHGGVDAWL